MDQAIRSRLDWRRQRLMHRSELIMEHAARGEGSTTSIELEVIADELAFIQHLYEVLLLGGIKRRVDGAY